MTDDALMFTHPPVEPVLPITRQTIPMPPTQPPRCSGPILMPVDRGLTTSSEIKIRQCADRKTWSFSAKLVLGAKTIEGGSTNRFGSLEAADAAAEEFIREAIKTLVHGQASQSPNYETTRPIPPETRHGM